MKSAAVGSLLTESCFWSDLGTEFIIAGSCGLTPTGQELETEEF